MFITFRISRTSRYFSRNRNNNNSYNTNNNNIHVTEKRALTVDVGTSKQGCVDETDVPPSPPINDTKNYKSAFSAKIK